MCFIWHVTIRKSGLTGKLTTSPIVFHSCIKLQHRPLFQEFSQLMRFSSDSRLWSDSVVRSVYFILCACHSVLQCSAWNISAFLSWKGLVKRRKSSVSNKDTLRYTLGIMFWCPKPCDIQQPFGLGGAGYHRFCCILWQSPGVNIFLFRECVHLCVSFLSFLSWKLCLICSEV
jgi:hypothetical protein